LGPLTCGLGDLLLQVDRRLGQLRILPDRRRRVDQVNRNAPGQLLVVPIRFLRAGVEEFAFQQPEHDAIALMQPVPFGEPEAVHEGAVERPQVHELVASVGASPEFRMGGRHVPFGDHDVVVAGSAQRHDFTIHRNGGHLALGEV
jgi:hypothetical protein